MSDINKPSLWQKIKQLLTTSAAHIESRMGTHNKTSTKAKADKVRPNPERRAAEQTKATSAATDSNSTYAEGAQVTGSDHEAINRTHINSNDISSHNVGNTDQAEATAAATESSTDTDIITDTPITDCLKRYLENQQWHYTQYQPKADDAQQTMHLSLRMRHKQAECGYLFRIQEKNGLLAVYGILPFLIPDTHQSAAMLLITQINYDMIIGNLEMDVSDGEIRYKHAIDVDAVGIDNHIIEHVLQSVVAMTTVAYDVFSDLINTQDPAADIPTLLGELQQQADARTFFLPTQLVQ